MEGNVKNGFSRKGKNSKFEKMFSELLRGVPRVPIGGLEHVFRNKWA